MDRLKRLIGRAEKPDAGESSGGSFQYTPLKDSSNFRILRLQNNFRDANRDHKKIPLRGSLVEASVHSPPEYYALSYCWGDPALSEEILIDGLSLKITANCASALRRMLRGKLGRHIWVDSICINQSNAPDALKERGLQVAMMDKIYRNATQVNVHLGEGDEAADVACESLTKLSLAVISAGIPGPGHEGRRQKYDKLAENVLTSTPVFPYGKLHGVFRLEWFTRTWVVQEVALAKQVMFYCGTHLIRLELVVLAADFTKIPYSKLDADVSAMHWRSYLEYHNKVKDLIQWRESKEPTAKLTSLLSLLVVPGFLFEATRPEDKVFALYGICKRLGYELPAPDYQKPLAVVYTEAARAILRYDQSLELLSVAMESSAWADGLPSWVPNFSGCMRRWSQSNPPQIIYMAARESIKTAGSTKSQYRLESNDTSLVVRGRRLGTIRAVGKPWKMDAYDTLLGGSATNKLQYVDSLIGCIGSWLAVVRGGSDSITRDAAIEHLTRVLTNNIGDGFPAVPFEDMVRYMSLLVSMSEPENPMNFAALANLPDGSLSPQQLELLGLMVGCHRAIARIYGSIWQTIFRTDGGYMGMGPYSLSVGDVVVLIQGCATAGVIRPSIGGFRYVGPAFVDGIMDREFWNPGSDSDLEWFALI